MEYRKAGRKKDRKNDTMKERQNEIKNKQIEKGRKKEIKEEIQKGRKNDRKEYNNNNKARRTINAEMKSIKSRHSDIKKDKKARQTEGNQERTKESQTARN